MTNYSASLVDMRTPPLITRWLQFASCTAAVAIASGCATQASLTVTSQPEGAFITEKGSGKSYGTAPVVVVYDTDTLKAYRGSDGCYRVKGFTARWVSGTTASLELVRLCGKTTGVYTITFGRDPSQPGFDKDMEFALRLQAVRAQRQQAQAAQDATAAALFSAWAAAQRTTVMCTSTQVGLIVQTQCR